MTNFAESEVTVTLTGAQWIALLARTLQRELSPTGIKEYNEASKRIQAQLLAASNASKE